MKTYYKDLDGLRGLAVGLVLISHFIINPYFAKFIYLKPGFLGVSIFFVLSGFLITEILLTEIAGGRPKERIVKRFFIRRTFRIFPIYYLLITGLAITRSIPPGDLIYSFTYTYNMVGDMNNTIRHTWSLCVEEQFYIFYPLLLVNTRKPLLLILSMIFIGLLSRVMISGEAYTYYMPACADCLGAGALLAWLKANKLELLKMWIRKLYIPIAAIVIFWGLAYYNYPLFLMFGRTLAAVVGFYMVAIGAMNTPNIYTRFLRLRPLVSIGRISYGVYLYHAVIYSLIGANTLAWIKEATGGGVFYYNAYLLNFIVMVGITLAVSYLSFVLIEKPLLRVKDRL